MRPYEIKRPSYDLRQIKRAFKNVGDLNMTFSAKFTQRALGFSDQDVIDAIQALMNKNFHKSMSPFTPGFSAWQDVYKSTFRGIKLYIKFQINNTRELILSFKEQSYEEIN